MDVRAVSITLDSSVEGLKSKFEVLKSIVKAGLGQGLVGDELKNAVNEALSKTNVKPEELVAELVSNLVEASKSSWLSSLLAYFSYFKSCIRK